MQKEDTNSPRDEGLLPPELLAFVRVIPHPWKTGETRNVYEFPVTRKIIIEADPTIPADEILDMAARCHDRELGLDITGVSLVGGYKMSLSPANNEDVDASRLPES